MSILIEGATIVSMDPERGSEPFEGNILIEGERIADHRRDWHRR